MVAPAWHTIGLLVLFVGLSLLDASAAPNDRGASNAPRPLLYGLVILFQWILFGLTYWGLRLRRVSIASVIAYRWSGWGGLGRCLLLSAVCWVTAFLGVTVGFEATGLRDPDEARRIIESFLPHGPLELSLWVLLSLTAGFVEEFVFRGYVQRQFSAWTRNHLAGAALTAMVFGVGHLYQGPATALLITSAAFGVSLFAYAARSLVPGMVAHAFEDVISGIFGRA
ncbi:MAG TPA: CPBP family intramembrane glutamic endopeptidase [Candidatus Eisenbacteria bacterium]|nr:CPBP family intramembrane glutamic endopeptidase [Candidatus Eisenbacteria bacterium]